MVPMVSGKRGWARGLAIERRKVGSGQFFFTMLKKFGASQDRTEQMEEIGTERHNNAVRRSQTPPGKGELPSGGV